MQALQKQPALEQLVERLTKAHGASLVSVVLYGSAAAGEHHKGFSDFNVLCVLSQVTPVEMGCCEDIFRWWREQDCPAPLLLSERELESSADCFAVEFRDIKAHHRILHGKDVASGLVIDDAFYRAQVEHDLRAKLLRLRQKAAGVLSEKEPLRRLMADSLSTFCVLFRHALILHGVETDSGKRTIIERTRETFGIDAAPFSKLLDLREGKIKSKELDAGAMLGSYLKDIDRVIEAVDALKKRAGGSTS